MTAFFKDEPALRSATMDPARKIEGVGAIIETYNRVGGLIEAVCEIIGIDKNAALAILMAESSGAGFKNGRLVIRFEVHWFWKKWGKDNRECFDAHFSPRSSWKGHLFDGRKFHGNQDKEWAVFDFACNLDFEAACQSTSFGGPQIMGFNHKRCGYDTATELFEVFKFSERFHILGLFDYFQTDERIMRALKTNDFHQVALRYNGSGQANNYAGIIRRYYRDAKKALGE